MNEAAESTTTGAPRAAPLDGELIDAARAYIASVEAVNTAPAGADLDDDTPEWRAHLEAEARLCDCPPPVTLAGVRVLAEVARARANPRPDGTRDYSSSFCADWPGEVIEGVLRLVPPQDAGASPELSAALAEVLALWMSREPLHTILGSDHRAREAKASLHAAGIPAASPADLCAKAGAVRSLILHLYGGAPDRLATPTELLAWSLAGDVLRLRGAA